MSIGLLLLSLVIIAFMSVVIMYACNSFEESADWLGRGMRPGVKGATLNAVGSSLPELFTTTIFLFGPLLLPAVFGTPGSDEDTFSAGIATTAGSAVFNAVVIPALCILAVVFFGVRQPDGSRRRIRAISLHKPTLIKDGFFFVLAELLLIWFLGDSHMAWWMGGVLALTYLIYISVTLGFGFESMDGEVSEEADDEEGGEDEKASAGILGLGWLLDLKSRWYGSAPFSTRSAWVVLSGSVVVIAVACGGIVWGVESSAAALGVPTYFTAVILAAAATSVPDTVLSVKDALKGNYDDAVANAVGSNIFDITICLGLPLLAYGLIVGEVHLQASGVSADVQVLRWVLLAVTAMVLSLLLIGSEIGAGKAILLFSLYLGWTGFVVGRALDAGWAKAVISILPGGYETSNGANSTSGGSELAPKPSLQGSER